VGKKKTDGVKGREMDPLLTGVRLRNSNLCLEKSRDGLPGKGECRMKLDKRIKRFGH